MTENTGPEVRHDDEDCHVERISELLRTQQQWARLLEVENASTGEFLEMTRRTLARDKVRHELDSALASRNKAAGDRAAALGSKPVAWSEEILGSLAILWILSVIIIVILFAVKQFGGLQSMPYLPFLLASAGLLLASAVALVVSIVLENRSIATVALTFDRAQNQYDSKLFSLVAVPTARSMQSVDFVLPELDPVVITEAPELSSRVGSDARVETSTFRRVFINMRREGGARVGLAGISGAGQTELIRNFCEGDGRPTIARGGTVGARLSVLAPYKADEFLSLLIRTLCESVPGVSEEAKGVGRWYRRGPITGMALGGALLLALGLVVYTGTEIQWNQQVLGILLIATGIVLSVVVPVVATWRSRRIAAALRSAASRGEAAKAAGRARAGMSTEARRQEATAYARNVMQRVRYAETRKVTREVSVSKVFAAKLGGERTLTALPLSKADLLLELKGLIAELRSAGYDIVIGLDDIDKLEINESTRGFLSDVRVVFEIEDCSFLVTTPEDRRSRAGRGAVSVTDFFGSALDATIRVDPLSFAESRSIIRRRTTNLSDTAIALCHCLSGGLPQDLLRYARALGVANDEFEEGSSLDVVCGRIVSKEVAARASSTLAAADRAEGSELPGRELTTELAKLAAGRTSAGRRRSACSTFLMTDTSFLRTSRQRLPLDETLDDRPANGGVDRTGSQVYQQFFSYLYSVSVITYLFSEDSSKLFGRSAAETIDLVSRLARIRLQVESDPDNAWRSISMLVKEMDISPRQIRLRRPSKGQENAAGSRIAVRSG